MSNEKNVTQEQQRIDYENKEELEARCELDSAEGYAMALCDQLEDIIEFIYPDDDFQSMSHDKVTLIANAVFNHRKALSALSEGVLDAIQRVHGKLD